MIYDDHSLYVWNLDDVNKVLSLFDFHCLVLGLIVRILIGVLGIILLGLLIPLLIFLGFQVLCAGLTWCVHMGYKESFL